MTPHELRLLRSIRDALHSLQQTVESIRARQERDNQTKTVDPSWLLPVLTAYQQSEVNRATSDNRQYRVQNSIRWATWCAFIAAAIYAAIAGGQMFYIYKQTQLLNRQLIATQAALLEMTITFNEASGELTGNINNGGPSTATGVTLTLDASERKLSDGSLLGDPVKASTPLQAIKSGKGYGKVWQLPFHATEIERSQGGKWPPNWPGERTFVFKTDIVYQNGFGQTAHTTICRQWLPGFAIKGKSRDMAGGGLYDCGEIESFIKSTQAIEREVEKANK